MGLGKTIQTIVSIRILFQEKEINNCLIVVPVSLISNWVFEFGIWVCYKTKNNSGKPKEKANSLFNAITCANSFV